MNAHTSIVLAGSSGFIGTELEKRLLSEGYSVTRLTRHVDPSASSESPVKQVAWDPSHGYIDQSTIDSADAVINLAGANISGKRWDRVSKKEILKSRIDATRTLVNAINRSSTPPTVLLSASATGYYGYPTGPVDESSPAGATFLADVCVDWEQSAIGALGSGTRVAFLRTGIVMSPRGGALKKLLLPLKLGFGGPLGSGEQVWSWISLEDEIRAICFVLEHRSAWGPVNLVAPHPATNKAITDELGRVLKRPTRMRVPQSVLRVALGQFSQEITQSVTVKPTVLNALGFKFSHPTVAEMAQWVAREK